MAVGTSVGNRDGTALGTTDGTVEGDEVGSLLGDEVGDDVGLNVSGENNALQTTHDATESCSPMIIVYTTSPVV